MTELAYVSDAPCFEFDSDLRWQQEVINQILENVGHFSKYVTSSATNLLPLNPTDHYIVLLWSCICHPERDPL